MLSVVCVLFILFMSVMKWLDENRDWDKRDKR